MISMTVKKTKNNTIYDTDGNEIYHYPYKGLRLSDIIYHVLYNKKSLRNAVLKPSVFKNKMHLDGLDLRGSWMVSSRFNGHDLNNVNFSGANLGMTKFTNCIFNNVNFSGADLTGVYFKNIRCDRDSINFEKSIMKFVYMRRASLRRIHAKDAIITNSDLRQFHIEGSDFSNVNFEYTMVDCAIFKYGKLTNADFSKAFFDQMVVTGSDITDTKFPKGYVLHKTSYGGTIVFSPNFDRSKSYFAL